MPVDLRWLEILKASGTQCAGAAAAVILIVGKSKRWGLATAVAILVIAASSLSASAQMIPEPAEGDRMAEMIRARGWACGRVVYIEETRKSSSGSTFFKLTCDYSGPFYEVEVHSDHSQTVRPLVERI